MSNGLKSVFLCLLLTMIAVGAAAQSPGTTVAYVSNPNDMAIYAIKSSDGVVYKEIIFREWFGDFQPTELPIIGELVVGPDDLLYVSVMYYEIEGGITGGGVFRFDPVNPPPEDEFPYRWEDVEFLDTEGVFAPQSLWFSDKGDLFLTDYSDETAVWIYQDLVPLSPDAPEAMLVPLVTTDDLGMESFLGQGITQAANGDLLFVDTYDQRVFSLGFDPVDGFDEAPMILLTGDDGLEDPIGIARASYGHVFVSNEYEVLGFGDGACGPYEFQIDDGPQQMPDYLQVTADDTLYIAASWHGNDQIGVSTLWSIQVGFVQGVQVCGEPEEVFSQYEPPGLFGVAVPRTERVKDEPIVSPDTGTLLYSFSDHAYELDIIPVGACGQSGESMDPMLASEVAPACLQNLIQNYTVDEDFEFVEGIEGSPVTYSGDGGFAQVYTIDGDCDPDEVIHSVSAYSRLTHNPRIVRCEFAGGNDYCHPPEPCLPGGDCYTAYCEIIQLDSFFPFNGIFPEDARISGTRSSAVSDFSEYFVADIADFGTYFGEEVDQGCFCGFRNPLPDVQVLDPDDPFAGLPRYRAGRSVPIKFRVAALPPGGSCEVDDPCNTCPHGWVRDAEVILSIAKVFDENGEDDFIPITPTPRGNQGSGNLFRPGTQYHYNLDTRGYEPGVYQAVAIAVTGNFSLEWTYFAIR